MTLLVNRDGQQLGPFTLEQARAALQSGTVYETDLAWVTGTPSWVPLSTILAGPAAGGPPGVKAQPAYAAGVAPASGLAVASLILGILSLVCASIFTGIPAIVCGHLARSRANRSPGEYGGAGMALAGLITGYFSLAIIPLFLAILVPAISAGWSKAQQAQMITGSRSIALACANYSAGHAGRYPDSLEELVPSYIADAKTLTSPLLKPPQTIGFEYLGAGKVNPDADEVLLISKWQNHQGWRVVTRVSGAANLQGPDSLSPAAPPTH